MWTGKIAGHHAFDSGAVLGAVNALRCASTPPAAGPSGIVVNYKATTIVKSIWILWEAQDRFFSPRLKNSNARSLNRNAAADNIEIIYEQT